jgi:hypothetical protein
MSALDYEKISRYVDDEMTVEERDIFEQQLHQDEELKKKVELYREANEVLKSRLHPDEGELALSDTIKKLRGGYFNKEGTAVKSQAKLINLKAFRWVAAAAAILIIALFIWSPWSQPDVYRQYASIEMPGLAERGSSSESLQKEIAEKFNGKKFEETIPLFESALRIDSANSFLHFYYSIALLETEKLDKARQELSQLFKYDAAFYMALSYLKEKNNTVCQQWLNKIPQDATIYPKAQQLMKEL